MGGIDFDQNLSGRRYESTAPVTAPQPRCPIMTMHLTLSLRAFSANSMLPMQTSPRTLPATRMTKRSLKPCPNSISSGTRASEQPTTTANGACLGIWPIVRFMPTSRPLHCTTYRGSPFETVLVRQLSIHLANIRLPSSSVLRAASASGGGGFTLGFLGSNR